MAKYDGSIRINTKIDSKEASSQLTTLENRIAKTADKIASLRSKMDSLKDAKIPTREFTDLQKEIDSTEKKLLSLYDKQERFLATGGKEDSAAYKKMSYDAETLEKKLQYAEQAMQNLVNSGKAFTLGSDTEEYAKLSQQLKYAENDMDALARKHDELMSKQRGASSGYSKIAQETKKAFSTVQSAISKAGSGIKRFGGFVKSAFSRLNKSANKSSGLMGTLASRFKGLALSLLIFNQISKAFNSLFSGIKKGLGNLAQVSAPVNSAISSLMSSLTQLKNSFATAFAPILTTVAPLLTSLINMLSRAATYVGMFIAALTGQKTFTKAVGVQEDYAASLGDTAKQAGKAEKALNSYLSPLDEINRYEDPSDSGVGSGGGGGYTGPSPGEMFQTVPIENSIKDMVKRIKDYIRSEDWAGLGGYVASGINAGMARIKQAISWSTVGPQITYLVNAFTTTLNSLVSGIDWDLLGSTIGTGINTVVNTLNLLITGIDWVNIGASFAAGVGGILNSVNWTNLGMMIGNKFMISWSIFYGFVQNLDWGQVGTSIANALNGIVSSIDLGTIGTTLGSAITGLFAMAVNFSQSFDWNALGTNIFTGINNLLYSLDFATIGEGITQFAHGFLESIKTALMGIDWVALGKSIVDAITSIDWLTLAIDLLDIGLLLIDGLLQGIVSGLVAIGIWLKENVFDPIVNGVKKLFGIHSPSTVFAELGEMLIEGLIKGVKAIIDSVIEVFELIWDSIQEVFGPVASWFKDKFEAAKKGIHEAFSSIGKWFGERYESITNTFKDIGSWFGDIFGSAYEAVTDAFENAGDFFGSIWESITGAFGNITGWFKDKFSAAWQAVKDVFSAGGAVFTGIKDGILDGLKSVINGLITGINNVISIPFEGIRSALDSIRNVSIAGAHPFSWLPTISVPQIPYLATGAVIPPNKEFMAVLGDQKHGNNIEAPEALIRKIVREESGDHSSSWEIRIPVILEGRQIFEAVVHQADLARAQSGRSSFEPV